MLNSIEMTMLGLFICHNLWIIYFGETSNNAKKKEDLLRHSISRQRLYYDGGVDDDSVHDEGCTIFIKLVLKTATQIMIWF